MEVTREVELDMTADEAWALVGTAEGWRQWLVDSGDMPVETGAEGELVDDGVARLVRVHSVEPGRAIVLHWHERDRLDELSSVTIEVVGLPDGRQRLRITEQWPTAVCADCPLRAGARWDLRACLLCLAARPTCRV